MKLQMNHANFIDGQFESSVYRDGTYSLVYAKPNKQFDTILHSLIGKRSAMGITALALQDFLTLTVMQQ